MTLLDNIPTLFAAGAGVLAGVWWVVSNITANNTEIKLLRQNNDTIQAMLRDMREEQREMRRDVQNLLAK